MNSKALEKLDVVDKQMTFLRIINDITENDIVLYMKGSIAFPKCGYSAALIDILDSFHLKYKTLDVLEDEELNRELKDFADCPSTPQLYIKGQFIGCCDKIRDMYFSGRLESLLRENGLIS